LGFSLLAAQALGAVEDARCVALDLVGRDEEQVAAAR
jgi:hypothetical protein